LGWLAVFLPAHVLDRMAIVVLPDRLHLLTLVDFGSFFIIGMMLYLLSTGRSSPLVIACLLLATLYNALGRWDWADIPASDYLIATVTFEVILFLAAKSRIGMLDAVLLVRLGQWSYSLYLLHISIGLLLWAACHSAGVSPVAGVVAGVPLSIGLSSLFHRWVEVPGQALFRRAFRLDGDRLYDTGLRR
jgi:peptidoglycan/LPS O-acetylase OafA/YrhL